MATTESTAVDGGARTYTKPSEYMRVLLDHLPKRILKPHPEDLAWAVIYLAVTCAGFAALRFPISLAGKITIAVVLGNNFASMCFLGHVLCHRGRSIGLARELAAWFCWTPLFVTPTLWRRWHNTEHHAHTNVRGKDPDHLFTLEDYQKWPLLRLLFDRPPFFVSLLLMSWFGSFTQQGLRLTATFVHFRPGTRRQTLGMAFGLLGAIVLWPTVAWSLGKDVFWFGYAIPFLIANLISGSYICVQHMLNPLLDERDPLAGTASVTLPSWLGWLDRYHQCVGAHTIHHLFPQIPPRHLRQAEDVLAEHFPDKFHRMPITTAWRLKWQTPYLFGEDNDTLIDPKRGRTSKTLGRGLDVPRKRGWP